MFSQWSQKCTICHKWLSAEDYIVNDTRPGECRQHMVHKTCLYPLSRNEDLETIPLGFENDDDLNDDDLNDDDLNDDDLNDDDLNDDDLKDDDLNDDDLKDDDLKDYANVHSESSLTRTQIYLTEKCYECGKVLTINEDITFDPKIKVLKHFNCNATCWTRLENIFW